MTSVIHIVFSSGSSWGSFCMIAMGRTTDSPFVVAAAVVVVVVVVVSIPGQSSHRLPHWYHDDVCSAVSDINEQKTLRRVKLNFGPVRAIKLSPMSQKPNGQREKGGAALMSFNVRSMRYSPSAVLLARDHPPPVGWCVQLPPVPPPP